VATGGAKDVNPRTTNIRANQTGRLKAMTDALPCPSCNQRGLVITITVPVTGHVEIPLEFVLCAPPGHAPVGRSVILLFHDNDQITMEVTKCRNHTIQSLQD
jgi:hypothetical protein